MVQKNIFSEKLKLIRKSCNLTIEAISKDLGMSLSGWYSAERGANFLSFQILKKLYDNYNISLDWLFSEEFDPDNPPVKKVDISLLRELEIDYQNQVQERTEHYKRIYENL